MNWEDFLDPYIRSKLSRRLEEPPPQSEPIIRAPQQSDYLQDESIRPQSWWESAKDFVTDIYPGRAAMTYMATGHPSVDIVGDLAGDFAGPIGKLGAIGGMVKMGGKIHPEAFLHRTINTGINALKHSGVDELGYAQKLLDKGMETEKPMSLVAPNYPYTFRSGDVGLLFNANEGDLKKIWPRDASTSAVKDKLLDRINDPYYEHLYDSIGFRKDVGPKDAAEAYAPELLRNYALHVLGPELMKRRMARADGEEGHDRAIEALKKSYLYLVTDWNNAAKKSTPEITQAILRRDNLKRDVIPNKDVFTEKWDSKLPIGKTQDEADLFQLFRDAIPFHRRKDFPEFINHNEAVGRYSGDNLAGIRISPDAPPDMVGPAIEFAERNGLPIYSWSSKGLTPRKWLYDVKKIINTEDLGSWKTREDPFFNTGKDIIYPEQKWGWPKKRRMKQSPEAGEQAWADFIVDLED